MSTLQNVNEPPISSSGSGSPVWWLMFKQEFSELWLGGKALNLLIMFSVLVSITSFLLATNSELNLTPPPQMEFITLQAIITFGLFIGLIISAESISGERERITLEPLLLTPASRQQIVVGKFLAAMTPWFASMILGIPYLVKLSLGDPILWPALFWGGLVGSLMAVTFTGLGMLVSIWSSSNKNSLFITLLIYLLSLLPQQLPGEVAASPIGPVLQMAGPLEASTQFLQKTLVNSKPLSEEWLLLTMCVVSAALVLGLLFFYAAPRLGLEGGRVNTNRSLNRAEAIK